MKSSPGRLRDIAVSVRATAAGRFEWLLLEGGIASGWAEIDASASPSDSYKTAMADGLLALQALIDDVEMGPREVVQEISEPKREQSRGFFGFGPV